MVHTQRMITIFTGGISGHIACIWMLCRTMQLKTHIPHVSHNSKHAVFTFNNQFAHSALIANFSRILSTIIQYRFLNSQSVLSTVILQLDAFVGLGDLFAILEPLGFLRFGCDTLEGDTVSFRDCEITQWGNKRHGESCKPHIYGY